MLLDLQERVSELCHCARFADEKCDVSSERAGLYLRPSVNVQARVIIAITGIFDRYDPKL